MPARMAMMAMTTSSSIKVNPEHLLGDANRWRGRRTSVFISDSNEKFEKRGVGFNQTQIESRRHAPSNL